MGTMSCIDHSTPATIETVNVSGGEKTNIDPRLIEHSALRLTDISDSLEEISKRLASLHHIEDLVDYLQALDPPDHDTIPELIKQEMGGLHAALHKSSESIVKAILGLKLKIELPSTDTKIEIASEPVKIEVPQSLYLIASLPFLYLVVYHLALHFLR